jgi:hypothetical protein
MAKKRRGGRPSGAGREYTRIEIQARPDWVARVDAAAEALTISRSAYIRIACDEKIQRDAGQAPARQS